MTFYKSKVNNWYDADMANRTRIRIPINSIRNLKIRWVNNLDFFIHALFE